MKNKNSQNSWCRKSVEDLMHEEAKEIETFSNGKISHCEIYSSFVKIANAVSKYATEEVIKQITKQLNYQGYEIYED